MLYSSWLLRLSFFAKKTFLNLSSYFYIKINLRQKDHVVLFWLKKAMKKTKF
nr:photosystem I subunit VIII [Chlorella vulgaris]